MTDENYEFQTIQEIADALKIKRQTLYNRSKKTGVNISKKSFNSDEWKALANNEKLTHDKKPNDNVNDNIYIDNKLNELKNRLDEQSKLIEFLKTEIQEKNKQINQAQQLQLIAEQKFNNEHIKLIELEESKITKRIWWKFWE
ncbi:replication initiation protein [Leuconostoc citreum]